MSRSRRGKPARNKSQRASLFKPGSKHARDQIRGVLLLAQLRLEMPYHVVAKAFVEALLFCNRAIPLLPECLV